MPASHPDLAFADGSDAMGTSARPGMDRAEPTPSADQQGIDRADAEAPDRHIPSICVPLLPTLQRYGRAALSAVISSWWQDWRKRRAPLGVSLPLLEAPRHRRHYTPEGSPADWMRSLGWDNTELTPEQCGRWLSTWNNEQAQVRTGSLRPWERGPGASRPARPDQHRIGRQLFQRVQPLRGVRNQQGRWHDNPTEVEDILWQSRQDVWDTAPPLPRQAEVILRHYFRDRRVDLPARPTPEWDRLATVALAPSGSAPSHDGEPYAANHPGVRFVACLLGQAIYAADNDDDMLERVLGPPIDLLVWILKKAGAETPSGMRPLQLPMCFRPTTHRYHHRGYSMGRRS